MFSARLERIKPFRVMEILARAAELESQGKDVIHMEVGEPDFPTAPAIVQAGQQALADGRTRYTPATGIPELRSAISDYYAQLGVAVDAQRIVVTAGASAGLNLLASLLIDPGQEMLITDPGYPCNEVFVEAVGGVPRRIPVAAAQGFQPRAEDIAQFWGDPTRALLLASPANPTGTMVPVDELQRIAEVVQRRTGALIVDEIYQGMTRQAPYSTVLQLNLPELYVLNSFSKFFGMTGWRLGWLVLPEAAVPGATKLAQNLFICPSAPAQYAALAAFSADALETHRNRADEMSQRCQVLHDGLAEIGLPTPVYPQGAFYLYVDISSTGMHSTTFCTRLLEEYFVAVTPGEDFGAHLSERYVRFAYTVDKDRLIEAVARIKSALACWSEDA